MLGWMILVCRQTPEERDAAIGGHENVLARWEAGFGGTSWLEQLVTDGKAVKLNGNGYPCRYVSTAEAVFPLLSSGPPLHSGPLVIGDDYVTPGGWTGNATFKRSEISECAPGETITIDAWDQS